MNPTNHSKQESATGYSSIERDVLYAKILYLIAHGKSNDTRPSDTADEILQLIQSHDEAREQALLDDLMNTARDYHEKYPDADYFDFAGLVAGMRVTDPNRGERA